MANQNPAPLPSFGLLGGLGHGDLTASGGSYGITGFDTTTSRTYVLIANTGFYAVSGKDAQLVPPVVNRAGFPAPLPHLGLILTGTTTAYVLVANTGLYSILGSDALIDSEVTASQGSYGISGQAVNFVRSYILTADQGSYGITGFDITPSIGSTARTLIADQGSYGITGFDAGLIAAHLLTADQGFYALLGQAATPTFGPINTFVLSAASGLYGVTGFNAGFTLVQYILDATTGYYFVQGFDANLTAPILGGEPERPGHYHHRKKPRPRIRTVREEMGDVVDTVITSLASPTPAAKGFVAKAAPELPASFELLSQEDKQDFIKLLPPPATDKEAEERKAIEALIALGLL